MSLREIDQALAPEYDRDQVMHIRVGNSSMLVPKGADAKDYLPQPYRDYLDVFDRKAAEVLPPRRSWDHAINLQPGTHPPAHRSYSMNKAQLTALRNYLD